MEPVTPLVRVAQLRIPSCDLDDPRTNAHSEPVDQFSFSPWHATEDHRPLGNVMRARRVVYRRARFSAVTVPNRPAFPLPDRDPRAAEDAIRMRVLPVGWVERSDTHHVFRNGG